MLVERERVANAGAKGDVLCVYANLGSAYDYLHVLYVL